MALAGKPLREGDGFVGAIDPLAAELRFKGVRRLMRRAQIGVNKDHRMGQHHMAAACRQRPPVLGGTDNLARRLALPAGEVVPAIAKEPFTARAWLATPKRARVRCSTAHSE